MNTSALVNKRRRARPGPATFAHHEAMLSILRGSGFPRLTELATLSTTAPTYPFDTSVDGIERFTDLFPEHAS